jgi:hypothetical protein
MPLIQVDHLGATLKKLAGTTPYLFAPNRVNQSLIQVRLTIKTSQNLVRDLRHTSRHPASLRRTGHSKPDPGPTERLKMRKGVYTDVSELLGRETYHTRDSG